LRANAGAGGTVGEGGAIGAHVGVFTTGRIERKVEARGGKIVVTIRVLNEQGYTAGGSAGYGVGSLGYTREASEGKSRGATFVFDPNDRSQADRYQQVTAVTTEEELRKLSGPGGPTETTEGRTSTTGATTDATVFGAGIRFLETGTLGKEETRDASGQVVRTTYTGSGTGGASLIVGGKQGPGSEQRDAISATVAQGKGGGEASRTRIETDYGKTVSRLSEHPVDVLVGAATGASPLLQETQNMQGKLLTDDSYVAIAEAAKNEGKWIATLAGNGSLNVNIDDWRKTRHKVLAANGDRPKIAEALSEYYAGGSGRGKTVEAIVGSTGIGFEFPDKLADQQPTYNDLMVGDPLSRSRELAAAGDRQGAIADLKSRDERVKRLASDLAARSTEFEDSKSFLEMQRRLDGRRAQLRSEIQKLTAPTPLPPPPAATDQLSAPAGKKLSKADQAKAEVAQGDAAARADVASRQADATEAERKKGDAVERIQGMAKGLVGARTKEDGVFARVESEYHGSFLGHAYTTTPNLSGTIEIAKAMTDLKKSYEEWDQLIDTMQAILKEAGGDPTTVDHYRPNRARYRELHQRTFGNPGL
jgi:hypothetical protein